jgi:hypothetical protein
MFVGLPLKKSVSFVVVRLGLNGKLCVLDSSKLCTLFLSTKKQRYRILLTQQVIPIVQHILFQEQSVLVAKEEVKYAVIFEGYIFPVM